MSEYIRTVKRELPLTKKAIYLHDM